MKNLLFFNKDGHPYNFTHNNKWEGKLMFDENASDTFRTIGMYIFEKVEPIEFNNDSEFVKLSYYDNSGITFTSKVKYQNETITGIEKENNASEFYSKWIFGVDFNKKFPNGTIIEFSNITGDTSHSSDFNSSNYFTVVNNRKDAIMIITHTDNNSFNFSFSSGTISNSLNVISVNDYNRNLSGDTFYQNLYSDKKISILNTGKNDKIISVNKSGLTYSYINDIKITGITGSDFKVRLYFLTERPKLYKGKTTITKDSNGNTIMELINLNSNFYTGSNVIIEDGIGNELFSGYSFSIDSIIKNETLAINKKIDLSKKTSHIYTRTNGTTTSTKTVVDYRLKFNGYLNIKSDDQIQLSANTISSHKNHNRKFRILDSNYSGGKTTLRIRGYLIPETNMYYKIIKNLKPKQRKKMYVTSSGYIPYDYTQVENTSTIYSTRNYLDFNQKILNETGTTYKNTIVSFLEQHQSLLYNNYGLETYHSERNDEGFLSVESIYGTYKPYIYVSGYTNDIKLIDDHSLSSNGLTERYDIITDDNLTSERTFKYETSKLSRPSSASILLNLNYNTSNYGFKLTLNDIEYFTKYSGNTQITIDLFISKWGDVLYNSGFNVTSGYTTGTNSGYSLNIVGTPDVNIWDLKMDVNLLSTYSIITHLENQGIILSGNEIRSNSIGYFNVGLSTGMIINISGSSYNDNNKEYNIIGLSEDTIQLSYQGAFFNESSLSIISKTRDFIRKPRGDYYKDIYFKISWLPINNKITPIDETIFFYDVSGSQLKPYKNIESLSYTGTLPLINTITNNVVYLNENPNTFESRVKNPKYQQTVFDDLEYKLEQLDSSSSYNWIPEPLEFYIGYNSKIEGVNYNHLKIEKIEKHENTNTQFNFSGYTEPGYTEVNNLFFSGYTLTYTNPQFNFISYGFKVGQLIEFRIKDQATLNQQIFDRTEIYEILSLNRNSIILDKSGTTFNTTGSTFYYKIEVQPKEIARFSVYGQTETEDVRFKVNLNNLGVQISDDTAKIFKESDIKDDAVDYRLLNRKRKEMLTTYREIYDYIGSYKGLINAINFFGYTDLELYEYYRNINKSSQLYKKLHKVLIPDIFDNSVEGWSEIDFISGKYQNQSKWTKTNLFNLTYRITDEDGNNVLMYTLEEVQYKLNKLKGWLRQNIIPVSANLIDITGIADSKQTLYQDYDESNQVKGVHISRNSTIVNFNYTSALNFGTDYLISVNFYVLSGGTSDINSHIVSETPDYFTAKIKTFYLSGTTMIPVQYHKLNKNDMTPYSFNIDKLIDPYIYIEVTTYDNAGNGLGVKNNKMFYFDEPRNHWLVNHNFDMTKFKYILNSDIITNLKEKDDIELLEKRYSTLINTSVETNVNATKLIKSIK